MLPSQFLLILKVFLTIDLWSRLLLISKNWTHQLPSICPLYKKKTLTVQKYNSKLMHFLHCHYYASHVARQLFCAIRNVLFSTPFRSSSSSCPTNQPTFLQMTNWFGLRPNLTLLWHRPTWLKGSSLSTSNHLNSDKLRDGNGARVGRTYKGGSLWMDFSISVEEDKNASAPISNARAMTGRIRDEQRKHFIFFWGSLSPGVFVLC